MEKLKVIVDEKGSINIWMDGCLIQGIVGIEFYWKRAKRLRGAPERVA